MLWQTNSSIQYYLTLTQVAGTAQVNIGLSHSRGRQPKNFSQRALFTVTGLVLQARHSERRVPEQPSVTK